MKHYGLTPKVSIISLLPLLLLCAVFASAQSTAIIGAGQATAPLPVMQAPRPDGLAADVHWPPTSEQIDQYWKIQDKQLRIDWPNLKHYMEANARLRPPALSENRVVFYGDSITDSWINVAPDFFKGGAYLDRGISGQTTPQMLVRFRQDVVDLRPNVVVILAGTNDIAGNTGPSSLKMIQDNFKSMVEIAQANGIRPILASILPASDYWWKPGVQPGPKIVAFNAWLSDYAQKNGLVYLNYHSAMVNNRLGLKANLSSEGVHPNKAGYAVMQLLAEQAIAQALAKTSAIK